ncbi:LysR substrate-binding domain-containing protein [Acuticoccus sp. MNP-M23]|uniref:LysR substrate-binding domain-containing protein n=1 Tax=Acuticoccus sp. MNP-M23 TaxID=3072793 RepID=UPI0028169180|nr:LysR substrate-binding domain-containing protein [Acuticoccus sp. MNP-M23]WMS41948.1 LysR substrate-binding domain-containing protein [Acuticoccus sp. MNP-M23]
MLSQRALEAFKTVMATGSASAAAQELSVSQPAVSRLLKTLEDSLELVLFTRAGNRLVPTDAARLLADEVEHAFVGLTDIEASARRIRRGEHGAVKLAAMPVISTTILVALTSELLASRPGVSLEINSMRTSSIIPVVARRQAELGFVSPRRVTPEVAVLAHDHFPYRCILRADDPLATRESLSLTDLAGRDFIGYTAASTTTGRILDRLIAQMPVPPRIRVRVHLSVVAHALVMRGVGIAVVDPFMARSHAEQGGISLPIDIGDGFGVSVIAPLGVPITQEVANMLDVYRALSKTYGALAQR